MLNRPRQAVQEAKIVNQGRSHLNIYCRWTRASTLGSWVSFVLLIIFPVFAFGEIRFEDGTQRAGVFKHTPTAASAWGDFNNDGWPDLWVSNHIGRQPSLYLNRQDGTFFDIADRVLADDDNADFHGAAWADFDNDGDQDLLILSGAGGGRGEGPNYLFVNQDGKLINKAKDLGLDYPLGQGRTPLWIDANRDGKLDVLLMNRPRAEAPSAIFLQNSNGFVEQSQKLNFQHSSRSRTENILGRITRLMNFQFPAAPEVIEVYDPFAQLAFLSGNGELELVAYMAYTRLFSVNTERFHEITHDFVFPNVRHVRDAAIEDFNGDAQLDWYFARASRPLDITQTDTTRLQGKMGKWRNQSTGVGFRTEGEISLRMYTPWLGPTVSVRETKPRLFIGNRSLELPNTMITVSPQEATVGELQHVVNDKSDSIFIEFDPGSKIWTLKNSVHRIGLVLTSTKPIDSLQTWGFTPSKGDLPDMLLIRENDTFVHRQQEITDGSTACVSVAAGDFDNDGDIDLYLVCTGPTENFPNLLYENDGEGFFVKVPKAGGAEGSDLGRGNQVVTADYDRDGFLDLFVTNGAGNSPFADDGPHQLFHNLGNDNHWLEIDLEGVASNHEGIGAKIVLSTKGRVQVRQQDGGMHSFSQDHARIHFGLGPHEKVERLTIFWPSGIVQNLTDIQANQIVVAQEPV